MIHTKRIPQIKPAYQPCLCRVAREVCSWARWASSRSKRGADVLAILQHRLPPTQTRRPISTKSTTKLQNQTLPKHWSVPHSMEPQESKSWRITLNCQGDMKLSGSGGRKSSQNKREVINVVPKRWQQLNTFAMQSLHVHLWKCSTTELIYKPLNLHFLLSFTDTLNTEVGCRTILRKQPMILWEMHRQSNEKLKNNPHETKRDTVTWIDL